VTARDIHIDGPANGFSVTNTQLTLERARLVGRTGTGYGITGSNATLNAMNVLISGFEERGIEWPTGSGSVDSSTIVDTGSGALDGPSGVYCSSSMTLRSTIVWTPASTLVPFQGCNVVSSIAGPVNAPGAMNVDPLFVSPADLDYHLQSSSPARDAVGTGPALDFEGDARPRGMRFDIGADEAP
jgi:hypothetical protein